MWNCLVCGAQLHIKNVECPMCKIFRPIETYDNIIHNPEKVTGAELEALKSRRKIEKQMILDLELHSDPSNDEESKHGYPPKWFMVSCDWLFKWKCFVSNKVSKNAMPNTNIQNEIRTSLNQRIGILPPGPISNSCLFVNEA